MSHCKIQKVNCVLGYSKITTYKIVWYYCVPVLWLPQIKALVGKWTYWAVPCLMRWWWSSLVRDTKSLKISFLINYVYFLALSTPLGDLSILLYLQISYLAQIPLLSCWCSLFYCSSSTTWYQHLHHGFPPLIGYPVF